MAISSLVNGGDAITTYVRPGMILQVLSALWTKNIFLDTSIFLIHDITAL